MRQLDPKEALFMQEGSNRGSVSSREDPPPDRWRGGSNERITGAQRT